MYCQPFRFASHEPSLKRLYWFSHSKPTVAQDVHQHAYAAAFNDPQFQPMTHTEFDPCNIEISILSPQREVFFQSEKALLAQLTAGESGLTIQDSQYQATFLPRVWQPLPNKKRFFKTP